jgi:hypothetical protein
MHYSTFDGTKITSTTSGPISQLLLRELSFMARSPQICRHGFLKVHAGEATLERTMFPGTKGRIKMIQPIMSLLFLSLLVGLPAREVHAESARVEGHTKCYTSTCSLEAAKIIGDIDASTADKVRQLLDDHRIAASHENKPPSKYGQNIEIDSNGGNVIAAMTIGRLLRSNRVGVQVHDHCYSSCVLIMAGAVTRCCFAGDLTGVGIHRPYLDLTLERISPSRARDLYVQVLQEMRAYLREMNVSEGLADAMLRIDPENMRLLRDTELEGFGLGLFDPVEAEMRDLEGATLYGLNRQEYLRRKALSTSRCDPIRDIREWSACGQTMMKTGKAPALPDFSAFSTPVEPSERHQGKAPALPDFSAFSEPVEPRERRQGKTPARAQNVDPQEILNGLGR